MTNHLHPLVRLRMCRESPPSPRSSFSSCGNVVLGRDNLTIPVLTLKTCCSTYCLCRLCRSIYCFVSIVLFYILFCVDCFVLYIVLCRLCCSIYCFVSIVLFYILFCVDCVVLYIALCRLCCSIYYFVSIVLSYILFCRLCCSIYCFVSIVLFCVLFVCKCVLYYCH